MEKIFLINIDLKVSFLMFPIILSLVMILLVHKIIMTKNVHWKAIIFGTVLTTIGVTIIQKIVTTNTIKETIIIMSSNVVIHILLLAFIFIIDTEIQLHKRVKRIKELKKEEK